MLIHFDPLIKKEAIIYIDYAILHLQSKNEMFTVINEDHIFLQKAGVKTDPHKMFFSLKNVQFFVQVTSPEEI